MPRVLLEVRGGPEGTMFTLPPDGCPSGYTQGIASGGDGSHGHTIIPPDAFRGVWVPAGAVFVLTAYEPGHTREQLVERLVRVLIHMNEDEVPI